MKRKRSYNIKHKKLIRLFVIGALGITTTYYLSIATHWGFKKIVDRCFDVGHVTVTFNDIYADSVREGLQAYIQDALADENFIYFDFDAFYKTLRVQFPVVQDVEWQHNQPGKGALLVKGYKPLYSVNKDYIVISSGHVVTRDFFKQYKVDELPKMSLAKGSYDNVESVKKIITFAQSLPKQAWEDFDVHYHDQNNIVLHSKQQKVVVQEVVTNIFESFKSDDTKRLAAVVDNMRKKNVYPKKRGSKIVFDLRFKKRVLVKTFDKNVRRRKG